VSGWYNLAIWHKGLRPAQLKKEPLCRMCAAQGKTVAATVVDHIEPHRGDWDKFTDPDNLQSLCKHHHDSVKQQQERRGYSTQIGQDGWPVDPQHPANRNLP
jgi:5-methylcytosine-specific restriction endonuclease McrA